MTVISAVLSRICTAHASDSFITQLQANGTYEAIEREKSKIVGVRHFRGALSYWGLATLGSWSTLDWLEQRVANATSFASAEDFARDLALQLQQALSNMHFARPTAAGVGIHFTAYEYVNNYWIPELFLISNWADPSYRSLRPEGVGVSRETYHIIEDELPREQHREPQYRLRVNAFLQEGRLLIFNNGDPVLFNAAANGVATMFGELSRRRRLRAPNEISTYLAIARRPIEIVSNAQQDFCERGMRLVGGHLHDLAVTQGGEYHSTTGDGI